MFRSVRGAMLCQSKVPTDTIIITATSAAIGIVGHDSPSTTTRISRNTPARNVESRVGRRSLHVDHRLADHRAAGHAAEESGDHVGDALAAASRLLLVCVSVMSSTSLAVISDSSSPTTASANA